MSPPSPDHGGGYAGMDVEALRALTAALQAVTTNMAEDRRLLNDIHTRIIRIESNRLDSQVAAIAAEQKLQAKEIEALKLAQATAGATQATAVGIAGWFARHSPWLFAVLLAAVMVLGIGERGAR